VTRPPDPDAVAAAQLRTELRSANTGAAARSIAERALAVKDGLLAAAAYEAAGLAERAAHHPIAAEQDFLAAGAAGDRAGDDATRGRALVRLIELSRWRGDSRRGAA